MFAGSRHHPYFQRARSPARPPDRPTYLYSSHLNTRTRSRDPPPGWRQDSPFEEPSVWPPPGNNFFGPRIERPPLNQAHPVWGVRAFFGPRFNVPSSSSPYTCGFDPLTGPTLGQPSSSLPFHDSGLGSPSANRSSPKESNIPDAQPFSTNPQWRPETEYARPFGTPVVDPAPLFSTSQSTPAGQPAGPSIENPGGVKRSNAGRRRLRQPLRRQTSIWGEGEVERHLLGGVRYGKWKKVAEIQVLAKQKVRTEEESQQDNIFFTAMENLAMDLTPNTYFDDYMDLVTHLKEDRETCLRAETKMRKKFQEERAAAEAKAKERKEKEEEERRREAKRREIEEENRVKRAEMKKRFREASARQKEARERAERERLAIEARERRLSEAREREERRRLQQEDAARKEAERVGQQLTLYDAKWAALKSSNDERTLDFSQLPWPILDITPTCPLDITYERLQHFVFHPLRQGLEGKSRRERVKMDMLKWHPDKFDAKVQDRVDECQKSTVLEAAGTVARFLTQMLKDEVAKEG